MNLKTLSNKIILGTTMLTATACHEPIHKVPRVIKNPFVERIDSFVNSSLNKPDTADLKLFAIDTLKITDKALNKPEELAKKLINKGQKRIPKVHTGTEIETKTYIFNEKIELIPSPVQKYSPQYVKDSTKAVMQNEVYTDNKNFYVPVKYYSKINPDLPKGIKLNTEIKQYSH